MRKLLRYIFVIGLLAGMVFWVGWVAVAPPYDSGTLSGVLFFGAYTLGVPFFLATSLLHVFLGPELGLGQQAMAVVLGAIPLWIAHRLLQARLGANP